MYYTKALVCWGVFKKVSLSLLRVGNIYIDIDQTISTRSRRLRSRDTVTIDDMQNQLRDCCKNKTDITRMDA